MKIGIWKKLVLQRAWAVPDSTDRNYQTRVQLLITEVGYLSPKVENGRPYHVCTTTDIVDKVPNIYFIIYLPYFRGYMMSRVVSSEVFTLVGGERNRRAG